MTIDKRALREVAERATKGPWEMEQENIWFTDEDGYTKHLAYVEQGDDVDDKQDHYNTAYIAAANPATVLALLDENIQLQREKDAIEAVALALRDDMRQAREQLEEAEKRNAVQQRSLDHRKFLLLSADEVQRDFAEALGCDGDNESIMEAIDDLKQHIAELESKNGYLQTIAHEQNELAIRANLDSINDAVEMDRLYKRIAELERSETQLINERDDAESALNDAYKAVMGQAPEWSNWFSFENAIEEMELVCELWRNQTDDVIQFRQRIQELEACAFNPAILDVIAERQRQQSVEGWAPEHDDEHFGGEMAMAAVCYINETGTVNRNGGKPWGWPWDASWWKPSGRRKNLVKAGALILAEIERIDRATDIGVKGEI